MTDPYEYLYKKNDKDLPNRRANDDWYLGNAPAATGSENLTSNFGWDNQQQQQPDHNSSNQSIYI
jgi:hypothetical protein